MGYAKGPRVLRGWLRSLATAATLTVTPLAAHTPEGPLSPRDECSGTPGLAALDQGLRDAVSDRDAAALLMLVDDDIQLDFGGGSGKPELVRRLTAPEYGLWQELDAALALGCGIAQEDSEPAYASWPWYFPKDIIPLDPFEAFIVTGEGVRLRAAADPQAQVIGAVSWDYVRMTDYPPEGAAFARVETRNGKKGYVARAYLRSLVDYRLLAAEREGKWRVSAFIAGD